MINCIFVGIGGFIGSVLRYLAGLIPFRKSSGFPINTLLINILGAFLIGIIVAVFSKNANLDKKLLLMLKVGICGGFTTFSSFALESLDLIKAGNWFLAVLYVVLSSVLGIAAVYFGNIIVR